MLRNEMHLIMRNFLFFMQTLVDELLKENLTIN